MTYFYFYNPKLFLDPGPWLERTKERDTSEEIQAKLSEYSSLLDDIKDVQSEIKEFPDATLQAKESALQQRRIETARQILMMEEEEDALMLLLLN